MSNQPQAASITVNVTAQKAEDQVDQIAAEENVQIFRRRDNCPYFQAAGCSQKVPRYFR